MCCQTKLQGALGTYSVVNSNVSVNYNVTAGTAIIRDASETEVVELGTTLGKISMPYTISNLSVSYSKNGRTITRSLPFLEEQINAGNKGKTRKGESAAYFATLPVDTDRVTGYLADLAGDDSGSDGCFKFYNLEITDTESPVVLTTKSNTSSDNYCDNNCDPSKYKNGKCQYPYVPCSNAPGSDPTCCVKIQ
jgi:hypothetical protein